MSSEESALVILVPESEELVGRWRTRFDRAAAYGVPAHITVLYPFVAPELIDRDVRDRLGTLFGTQEPFDFSLTETRRFHDQILYLVPSAEQRFTQLTQAVVASFPDHPPYEGRFEKIVAHLTVADLAEAEQLEIVEVALSPKLPILAHARTISLLVGRDEPATWHVAGEFALGPLF
jgi:hypothetical protein